jgi:ABC-2 type transport system ATP-binding protein
MLKQGKVVALAATSELLKAASSNVLRFKIDSELPEELARKARITGRIVQFPAHNAAEIESYLAAVRQAGLEARDVEIRKADLEDVFLDVMSGVFSSADGPPLGARAPSGGSAAHKVTSVGVIP